MAPRPKPTAATMNENPVATPAICGSERRKPYVRPDDSSMMLFGPGVKNITRANMRKAMKSGCDIWRSGDVRQDLRPLRQQHDGGAADHSDHYGQPQRSEGLAKHDARCRRADDRAQQSRGHT